MDTKLCSKVVPSRAAAMCVSSTSDSRRATEWKRGISVRCSFSLSTCAKEQPRNPASAELGLLIHTLVGRTHVVGSHRNIGGQSYASMLL